MHVSAAEATNLHSVIKERNKNRRDDFLGTLWRQEEGDSYWPLTFWQKPTEKQTARDKQSRGVGVMNMLPPMVWMTL